MKRAISGALVVIGLIATTPALAEEAEGDVTANDVIALWEQEDSTAIAYLNGVATGVIWTNHLRPIFCLPPKLRLTQQQNVAIVIEHIRQHPEHGNLPLPVVMLVGLKETFPCK
jgi:hypothetical protein